MRTDPMADFRWRSDMEIVRLHYTDLMQQEKMIARFMEVVQSNRTLLAEVRKKNPYFNTGPRMWYAYYGAVSLRAIGDTDSRCRSLTNILKSMAAAGTESPFYPRFAPKRLLTDRDRVIAIIKPMKDFVDRMVVHRDRRGLAPGAKYPTFNDIRDCMNDLRPFMLRYGRLLLGKVSALKYRLPHRWDSIFEVVWVKVDEKT